MSDYKIIYTKTDEAPMLATYSWFPVIQKYLEQAGVKLEIEDISLAGRILANFSEYLKDDQKRHDALSLLGEIAKTPTANIIKLPNISASIPQLKEAIKELQSKGFEIPSFPENPSSEKEKTIRQKYSKVLGSAVNPVLREGNSDRRVAGPVKEFAKNNPHRMGAWSSDSKSHVASMKDGDFYGSEKSEVMNTNGQLKIEWFGKAGSKVLKESVAFESGDIIDAAVMNRTKLRQYFDAEINSAHKSNLLLSLHMKATMMKVSDPVIFGECVDAYYDKVFESFPELKAVLKVKTTNGIGDLYSKISTLDEAQKSLILDAVDEVYESRPKLAMVDSDKGITNLHVPSDVIIDASMPACIKSSGKMWGSDGELHDTKALIPDRSYAGVYQAVIEDCKKNGAYNVTTMGNVSNVGLMAKKAQEYGSHDKTFIIEDEGTIKVSDQNGKIVFEHEVSKGDIWRMCQVKDVAIQDWIKLAIKRSVATGNPVVFWLDENRAHDKNLIQKVNKGISEMDISKAEYSILSPIEATKKTLERVRSGQDTISASGNVLRDYLTDLFPILELGTSAKMLSIVPLLNGGGLYETGAGGSAPKHVDQFSSEGHLRWDSLGEFLALGVSLEDIGEKSNNSKATQLASALNVATSKFLKENKSPSRKVGELDTRGSHFYLSLYWAEALADSATDGELKTTFTDITKKLRQSEESIISELKDAQGKAIDVGGYYLPDDQLASKAMRASKTWNNIIN